MTRAKPMRTFACEHCGMRVGTAYIGFKAHFMGKVAHQLCGPCLVLYLHKSAIAMLSAERKRGKGTRRRQQAKLEAMWKLAQKPQGEKADEP
jgi:hypothetical protein